MKALLKWIVGVIALTFLAVPFEAAEAKPGDGVKKRHERRVDRRKDRRELRKKRRENREERINKSQAAPATDTAKPATEGAAAPEPVAPDAAAPAADQPAQ